MLNEALRLIRVFHDIKSTELAKNLGISQSYLSEIEAGKKKPSMAIIDEYARIFRTTPSAILLFSESMNDRNNLGPFKSSIRNKLLKFLQAIENAEINKLPD
jgi:transcriptional regulator with XRE-family HTH domain